MLNINCFGVMSFTNTISETKNGVPSPFTASDDHLAKTSKLKLHHNTEYSQYFSEQAEICKDIFYSKNISETAG